MIHLFFWFRLALVLVIGSYGIPVGIASTDSALVSKIKAVCIYNFARYVQWPESTFEDTTSPIRICMIGKDKVSEILRARNDLKVKDRNLDILYYEKPPESSQAKSCHMLYWNPESEKEVQQLVKDDLGQGVLTVSDTSEHSMVQFRLKAGKIKFSIRNDAVKSSGLNMSSQLLKLAVKD